MKQIYSETKDKINNIALTMGFHLKGKTYYRLNSDYIQVFKIYTNYPSYSVRFYQVPLCGRFDKTTEGLDVSVFWNGNSMPFSLIELYSKDLYQDNPFGIQITQDNYVNEASDILSRSVLEYVLPYFKESENLEKAYESEYNLMVNAARLSKVVLNEEVEKYISIAYANIWADWNLQMRRYDEALEFYKIRLNELRKYNNINNYSELTNLIKKLNESDDEYINKYIHSRRFQNLKNIGLVRQYRTMMGIWKLVI